MNTGNDDLFEGLSIMTPGEMEDNLSEEAPKDEEIQEEIEEKEEKEKDEDQLTIAPVEGEIKEDDEEAEITSTNNDDKGTSNSKLYSALIKDLIDADIISGPEEEEELKELLENASPEAIKKLMEGTIEKTVESKTDSWKSSFSGAKKKFLEIEDAFNETDDAIKIAQRLEFFENITEDALDEDETLQKNIYYDYLLRKGFNEEEAREAVEEADSIDKLKEKAVKAVPYLKQDAQKTVDDARDARQAAAKKSEEEYQERYTKLMETIDERESFVAGLKLNKNSREKLKKNISTPVYTDKNTGKEYTSLLYKQMRNPVEFEMLINYYDSIGMFNIDDKGKFKPDISKLKNAAKTKAVSELERVVGDESERGIGRNTSVKSSEKSQGILDMLDAAYGKNKKRK
jgi:hypothetical protein